MQVRGSTMLITGASSGIGAACARRAAAMGARVVLLARTRPALEQLAAAIRAAGGAADAYPVDLTDANAVAATVERVLAEVGVPDIVLSNAGAGRWLFLEETSPDEAVAMMAMPYFAALYLTRALLPAMLKRGRGRLIYVNSPAALAPWPGATAYTAARWALRGFAEALRADLHGTGVRVATVIPGRVSSGYFEHNPGVLEREPRLSRLLLPTLTPEQAAAHMLRGIERDARLIIFPTPLKLLYLFDRALPGPVRWLAARTGARRDRLA
ncbi:SDR family NAD(P)-dependent oxidoreductase [Kouleothrix sp.]|uniref:SDR family NAD(P)-dependent oxidoreductase n=1 Tax=Kouleothrix sp. TaxID=2779161 RepID=UPI0039192B55